MASRLALASALVLTAACGDDVAGPGPKAAKIQLLTHTSGTVTTYPGAALGEPVLVRLLTAKNLAAPNTLVRFSVAGSGTGTTGAYVSIDSAFTDENGYAEFNVIAGTAGTYTVTVSSEGVTPVTITVNAAAPVADAIHVFAGNAQGGFQGEPIAPFTALVLNELGLPQPGVTVNFAVTSGGGSVAPTSAITDANGRASTTLTLGPGATQTVTATAAGLTASGSTNTSAVFTATVANPCTVARVLAVPATVNRSLDTVDCLNAQNRRIEFHSFTTTAALTSILATETSAAFAPALTLSKPGGLDTLAKDTLLAPGSVAYRIFAPAGTWWLGASSQLANTTGAFTLSTAAAALTNDNCPTTKIFVVPGTATAKTSISGNVAATDCVFSGDAAEKADQYFVYLKAGQVLRIELQAVPLAASSIDLWIRVQNLTTGAFNNTDCCGGATVESRTHTAANTGIYRIETGVYFDPGSPTPHTGPYLLDIWVP